jgi:hypothetical protein
MDTSGQSIANDIVEFNVSFTPADGVLDCSKEIRVTQADGVSEINSTVVKQKISGGFCTGATIRTYWNRTANQNTTLYVYFNNSQAVPSQQIVQPATTIPILKQWYIDFSGAGTGTFPYAVCDLQDDGEFACYKTSLPFGGHAIFVANFSSLSGQAKYLLFEPPVFPCIPEQMLNTFLVDYDFDGSREVVLGFQSGMGGKVCLRAYTNNLTVEKSAQDVDVPIETNPHGAIVDFTPDFGLEYVYSAGWNDLADKYITVANIANNFATVSTAVVQPFGFFSTPTGTTVGNFTSPNNIEAVSFFRSGSNANYGMSLFSQNLTRLLDTPQTTTPSFDVHYGIGLDYDNDGVQELFTRFGVKTVGIFNASGLASLEPEKTISVDAEISMGLDDIVGDGTKWLAVSDFVDATTLFLGIYSTEDGAPLYKVNIHNATPVTQLSNVIRWNLRIQRNQTLPDINNDGSKDLMVYAGFTNETHNGVQVTFVSPAYRFDTSSPVETQAMNQPPTVSILNPLNQTYPAGAFNFIFKATDDSSTTFLLRAYLDGSLIYDNSAYPNDTTVSISLSLTAGVYNFTVFANDNDAIDPKTDTATVIFTVVPPNQPPIVSILDPLNQTYPEGTFNFTFKAVDDSSTTFTVKAYLNGNLQYNNPAYANNSIVTFSLPLTSAVYNFTVFANDNDAIDPKTDTATVIFTVVPPPAPPMLFKHTIAGFLLTALLPVIATAGTIVVALQKMLEPSRTMEDIINAVIMIAIATAIFIIIFPTLEAVGNTPVG